MRVGFDHESRSGGKNCNRQREQTKISVAGNGFALTIFNMPGAPQTMCSARVIFLLFVFLWFISVITLVYPHKLWSVAAAQCNSIWPGKAKFDKSQCLSVKAPCSEWVSAEVKYISAEGNDRTGFATHTDAKTTDYRRKGSQSGLKYRGVSHRVEWAEDYLSVQHQRRTSSTLQKT